MSPISSIAKQTQDNVRSFEIHSRLTSCWSFLALGDTPSKKKWPGAATNGSYHRIWPIWYPVATDEYAKKLGATRKQISAVWTNAAEMSISKGNVKWWSVLRSVQARIEARLDRWVTNKQYKWYSHTRTTIWICRSGKKNWNARFRLNASVNRLRRIPNEATMFESVETRCRYPKESTYLFGGITSARLLRLLVLLK